MNEQENREKVIKGLECCISGNPAICKRVGCPYAEEHDGIGDTCIDHLMADALALLKAQEPKIISLRDVVCADVGNVIWLETYYDGKTGIEPFLVHIDFTQKPVIINGWDSFYNISEQELNEDIVNSFADGFTVRKFRFWNVRPTEEQRKAVKWE